MNIPHLSLPVDETSRAQFEADGLILRQVDAGDAEDHRLWSDAVMRGFLAAAETPERTEARRPFAQADRLTGVYDPGAAIPSEPVATTHCWPAELTLPGGLPLPAWAVSGVTVAQTHRRRGIARLLMEAELRAAIALQLPVAMLTVSESTIYGRFGYSPAAFARELTISTRRVRWTGPVTTGRIYYVTGEQIREDGFTLVERVRGVVPGEVSYSGTGHLWLRQIGLGPDNESVKKLRIVRYDDAAGTAQGFAVFELVENEADFTDHELKLHRLVAATDDAYAGLWRFVLEMDLVSKVTATMRPLDEPLRWLVGDFRAVRVAEYDHLWVRVLDVPVALSGRRYRRSDRLVVRVEDPLGHAEGTWAITVDAAGSATVTAVDETPDATLSVNALGSLLLGGVPAATLVAAGLAVGDAERLDGLFRSSVEPFCSTWF